MSYNTFPYKSLILTFNSKLFTAVLINNGTSKPAVAMSVLVTNVVQDKTRSSLSGVTKNIVLSYFLTTKLDFLYVINDLLNCQPSYL